MAALNFPNSPAINDTWPSPPQTGVPTYKWDGTDWLAASTTVKYDATFSGALFGLTLSTAGASPIFGIARGSAADSTAVTSMVLGTPYTKTTSAWTVGTGVGGLDTGIIANSTWYHVYIIKRPDTGVTDILFSLSATAPALPAGYTLFRRIGSIKTNASGQWVRFIQDGDNFTWDSPPADVNVSNPGTASVIRTISTPPGIRVEAILMLGWGGSALGDNPAAIYLSDLMITDLAPNVGTGTLYVYSASVLINNASLVTRIFTNTASQIRSRLQLSGVNTAMYITTYGWIDRRGRDA